MKVELVTNDAKDAPPIMHHHVHFVNTQFVEMQQWYMKALDATLRPGQTDFFIGADLPGVGYMLNFFSWLPAQKLVGTSGRAIDHIGFEVRDLPDFLKRLDAKGIKLREPYRKSPGAWQYRCRFAYRSVGDFDRAYGRASFGSVNAGWQPARRISSCPTGQCRATRSPVLQIRRRLQRNQDVVVQEVISAWRKTILSVMRLRSRRTRTRVS